MLPTEETCAGPTGYLKATHITGKKVDFQLRHLMPFLVRVGDNTNQSCLANNVVDEFPQGFDKASQAKWCRGTLRDQV